MPQPALRQTALRRSGPGSPTLDGVVRASVFPVHTDRSPRCLRLGGHRVGAPAGARDDAPFSGAATLHERPLTPPVTHALRTAVGATIRFACAEGRLRRRLVKGDCLRRPETPSIGRCSLDLRHPVKDAAVPIPRFGWEPVTVLLAWPRGAGFRGPFANLCSREGWLGSVRGPRALHAWLNDAGHRLSTSAIETIHEHDHECPSSAAPHPQSPAGAAFLPEAAPFRARSGLRMAHLAFASWPAEVPRVRGRVVGDGEAGAQLERDLSHRDRSREELCPDPIDSSTSCREP